MTSCVSEAIYFTAEDKVCFYYFLLGEQGRCFLSKVSHHSFQLLLFRVFLRLVDQNQASFASLDVVKPPRSLQLQIGYKVIS